MRPQAGICQIWSLLVSKLSCLSRAKGGNSFLSHLHPVMGRVQGVTGSLQSSLRELRFIQLVAGVSHLLDPVLTWDPSTSVYDQSLCKPLWAPILTWTGGSVVSSPTSNKACMAWLRGGYRADVWNVGVYSRTAFAVPSSPSPGGAKTGRLALPAHREFANGPTSERRTTSSDNRVFDLLRGSMSYKTHNLNVQT